MSLNPCEKCGSEDNVKEFTHFDPVSTEWLCWNCREPIIMERVHGQNDPEDTWTPDRHEDEQSGITDFI